MAILAIGGTAKEAVAKTSGMVFCPPRPSGLMQWFIYTTLPFWFRYTLKRFSVSIDEASLDRLRRLRGQRCLLLPNHPSPWDPWALVALARRLNEGFFYVAAREVFDRAYKLQGWLLQTMGCYSVVRGASDKESFRTTKDILANNRGRLVIFVEGEISNQNDSLLPLEPGVVQLGFLAMQEMFRQVDKDLSRLPSLYVCPIALRYFYEARHLEDHIEQAVRQLEKATGLDGTGKTTFERLRQLGYRVLEQSAQQFGYALTPSEPLDDQIRGLEHFILCKLEQVVNLPLDGHLSYLDRIRRIRNAVDKVLKDSHPEEMTAYQHRLYQHQKAVLKHFYWDLDRLVNFIAIYDGYLHPDMTPERHVEMIRRFEKEVFGEYLFRHPRTVVLQVLEPIDLRDHFEAFLQDKKKAAEQLILQIERALFEAIQGAKSPQKQH